MMIVLIGVGLAMAVSGIILAATRPRAVVPVRVRTPRRR
jgi:hypothetical protein